MLPSECSKLIIGLADNLGAHSLLDQSKEDDKSNPFNVEWLIDLGLFIDKEVITDWWLLKISIIGSFSL